MYHTIVNFILITERRIAIVIKLITYYFKMILKQG